MQLSYRIIKNNSIKDDGLREIVTNLEKPQITSYTEDAVSSINMEGYNNLASTILENARRQKEQILAKAYEDAAMIEDNAMKEAEKLKKAAYENGYGEGKEQGYNLAYKEALDEAEVKKNSIIASAEEILFNAKIEYESYLENKKSELIDLVVCAAEAVLKNEVKDKSSINKMIFDALEASKNANNFIIRCNEIYAMELKEQVENWKDNLGYHGDIFVVKDNTIEAGNAIINKGNGKLVIGINYALQRIRELLEGKE
ncbi:FliH/SctL family protein [Candidatus Clostridium radicumherbarum]|uniref:FliH/SctL family protein n=1 Tax=Candidatus Clostridium radicumherbarum TaxID=3381662 RepID=A0ABW8TX79_9CLOT